MLSHISVCLLDKIEFRKSMKNAIKTLQALEDQYDSIACSGYSGAIFCGQLANELDKNLVIIRPKNHKSHGNDVEYIRVPEKYIIVDDLVESGSTVNFINSQIKDWWFDLSPEFKLAYMYTTNKILTPDKF